MRILKVSSVPNGLIVANLFVHVSVPSAKLGLEDLQTQTAKGKKGAQKRAESLCHAQSLEGPQRPSGGSKIKSNPQQRGTKS